MQLILGKDIDSKYLKVLHGYLQLGKGGLVDVIQVQDALLNSSNIILKFRRL